MSKGWQMITGDCLEVMATLEAGSVRLVFADPPYNQGMDYGPHHNDAMPPEVYLACCADRLEAAVRLLTPDGSLWLVISHEWDWQLIPLAIKAGFNFRQRITWYESFGVNCTGKFNRCSRAVLWFVRDPGRFVFNDCPAIRRPSDRQKKYHDKRANPEGKLWDDVWIIPRLAGTHGEWLQGFPTQLPIRLLRPIVACASDPGDMVLDPFAGSATSGAAAVETSGRYIGIERGERFASRAKKRLEGVNLMLALA